MRWCVLVTVLVFLMVPNVITGQVMPDCAELLRARCQSCHYLERVCAQVEKKSKRRWKATLKRMVKRRGAEITVEEQEILLNCLSIPAPDIKKECGK